MGPRSLGQNRGRRQVGTCLGGVSDTTRAWTMDAVRGVRVALERFECDVRLGIAVVRRIHAHRHVLRRKRERRGESGEAERERQRVEYGEADRMTAITVRPACLQEVPAATIHRGRAAYP